MSLVVVPQWPIFKAFWDSPWAKTRDLGLKKSQKPLFETPKWPRINFRTMRFDPFFDPLFVQKWPLFKAYWDFPWAKTRHHWLKMP